MRCKPSALSKLGYRIVKLTSGSHSVHSLAHGETFHPVVGPVAEAEALYVQQLKLRERVCGCPAEFVVWDIGLGAAANPITVLRAVQDLPARLLILSFDETIEPLRFALQQTEQLDYLRGYEDPLNQLMTHGSVE